MEDVGSASAQTLALSGELDIASAPMLEAAFAARCETGRNVMVLDLSQLTFMDSTGLRALIAANELCAQHGRELSLTGATGPVRRLLELTGAIDALPVHGRRSAGA